MAAASAVVGGPARFRAKRRAMAILNARTTEQRLPWYRDLIHVTNKTVESAERVAEELDHVEPLDIIGLLRAGVLAQQLRHYAELAKRVISQTGQETYNRPSRHRRDRARLHLAVTATPR
jgi:hypothetical protein